MRPRVLAGTLAFLVVLSGVAAGVTVSVTHLPGAPDQLPVEEESEDVMDFIRPLTQIAQDEALTKNERALRIVEQAARQQVARLGVGWNDDIYVPEHARPSDAIRALANHLGGVIGPEQEAALERFDALPEPVRDTLAEVVNAFHAVDLAAKNVYAEVDPESLKELEAQGDGFVDDSLLEGIRTRVADIFGARLKLVEAALEMKEALEEAGDDLEVPSLMVPMGHQNEPLDDVEHYDEDNGICINCHEDDPSTEDNTYEGDYRLLIDTSLEADKKYHNNAGGHQSAMFGWAGVSALVDFGGDNAYGDPDNPRSEGSNGGAHAEMTSSAVGMLLSLGDGNSTFTAGSRGVNGGAWSDSGNLLQNGIAVGLLLSMGGHDKFMAGNQGVNGGSLTPNVFATVTAHPMGLLLNMKGDDQYIASGDQDVNGGGSGTIGTGLLLDASGRDYYEEGGEPGCWDCSEIPKGQGAQIDLEGDDSGEDPQGDLEPDRIEIHDIDGDNITELSLELTAGEPVRLFARGFNETEEEWLNVTVTWSVDPEERGAFSRQEPPHSRGPNVTFTPQEAGVGLITANHDDGPEAVVDVDIGHGELAAVQIQRQMNGGQRANVTDDNQFTAGADVVLFAAGYDAFGNSRFEDVQVTWSTDPEDLGSFDPETGPSTTFTPMDATAGVLTAHFNDTVSQDVDIEIEPGEVDSLEIQRQGSGGRVVVTDGHQFTAGEDIELFAVGYDQFENQVGDVSATWSTDQEEQGSFAPVEGANVLFTPKKGPTGGITASFTSNGAAIDATAEIEIHPGSPARLAVSDPPVLVVNEASPLVVHVEDAYGNPVEGVGDVDVTLVLNETIAGDDSFVEQEAEMIDSQATFTVEYCCTAGQITLIANATDEDDDEIWDGAVINVTVGPGPLHRVLVQDQPVLPRSDQASWEITVSDFLTLHAVGYDEFGNLRGAEPVEWTADWEGDNELTWEPPQDPVPAVQFESQHAGVATFTATPQDTEALDTGFQITIHPGNPEHILIRTAADNGGVEVDDQHLDGLHGGQSVTLFAAGYDVHGNYVGDTPVTWELDPQEQRGTLDKTTASPTVRFTAKEIGEGFINVTGPVPVGNDVLPVNVTDPGPPGELVFVSPAELATAGQTWSPIKVQIEDGFGNHVTHDDATRVRLSLGDGFDGTLDGTLVTQATDGIATFDTVSYTVADEIWIVAEAIDSNGQVVAGIQDIAHGPYAVHPADLDSIRIQREGPDGRTDVTALDLTAGGEVTVFAAGFDAFENLVGDVSSSWSVDPEGSGTFDSTQGPSVTFTPETAGQGGILASKDGLQTSVEISVAAGSLDIIQIRDAPDGGGEEVETLRLPTGQETDLYAAGYDAHGNYIQDVPVWWRVDPTRLGSLESNEPQDNVTFLAKDGGTGRIVVDHDDLPGDAMLSLTVEADAVPPHAAITASCSELTCTLDADSTAGDAPITSYEWDLGDGTRAQQERFTHTYEEQGDYDVTLTVTDEDGLIHEAHQTVTVALPPDPVIELRLETRAGDPAPGAMTASARVDNVGSVALEQFRVVFTLDDEVLREQSYARLEAGENMTFSAAWEARQGNHTLVVAVPDRASASQVIEVILPVMDKGAPPDQEAPAPGAVLVLLAFAAPWIRRRQSLQDKHSDLLERQSHGLRTQDEETDRTTQAVPRGPRP